MSSDEFRMKFKKKFWKMIILHSIVVVRLYSSYNQILSRACQVYSTWTNFTVLFFNDFVEWTRVRNIYVFFICWRLNLFNGRIAQYSYSVLFWSGYGIHPLYSDPDTESIHYILIRIRNPTTENRIPDLNLKGTVVLNSSDPHPAPQADLRVWCWSQRTVTFDHKLAY